MKAILNNYHQSPRKTRLVAALVKGWPVTRAKLELSGLAKRAALPLTKLIDSAVANAVNNFQAAPGELMIKDLVVNQGITFKRFRPVSRGRPHPVRRRTSRVTVVLDYLPKPATPAKPTAPAKKQS